MKQVDVSIVISAYNEEAMLPGCLESIKPLGAEIIVVNNSSTDKTEEIAGKFTERIYHQKNDPQKIDLQKNFGFSKATKSWILSLDADERLTPDLIAEIRTVIEKNEEGVVGYWIPRKNIIFGKWIEHSLWWPDYQLRLFRKGKGKFTEESVHKAITVQGETKKILSPMEHINYTSVSQYLQKMDRIYTENEAEHFLRSGKKITWVDALRFPANDFLKTFFLQKGYKDGLHGLVLSLLQAFYMEVVFAKIWERQGFFEVNSGQFLDDFTKESKKIASDFGYWVTNEKVEHTKNPFKRAALKGKRKLSSL